MDKDVQDWLHKLIEQKLAEKEEAVANKFTALEDDAQTTIKYLHKRLDWLKSRPDLCGEPKQVARLVESIENVLQMTWGFDVSAEHHQHWYLIKGCTCPKMDNRDSWGYQRIINKSCPFHGE